MATLLREDGSKTEVEPANPAEGFSLEELYRLLDCTTVEVIYHLPGGKILIVDEDGKFRRPLVVNHEATKLARTRIMPTDFITGHAILCDDGELK